GTAPRAKLPRGGRPWPLQAAGRGGRERSGRERAPRIGGIPRMVRSGAGHGAGRRARAAGGPRRGRGGQSTVSCGTRRMSRGTRRGPIVRLAGRLAPLAAGLLIAACVGAGPGAGGERDAMRIVVVSHGQSSDPFWSVV